MIRCDPACARRRGLMPVLALMLAVTACWVSDQGVRIVTG